MSVRLDRDIDVSLIVAMSQNYCIGADGNIPWRVPSDMRHFKAYTTGKLVVMGRKTFETMPNLLADRSTVVLTSGDITDGIQSRFDHWKEKNKGTDKKMPTVYVVHNFRELFESDLPNMFEEIVIAGGAQIYKAAYPFVNKTVITVVNTVAMGDTFFPVEMSRSTESEWVRGSMDGPIQEEGDEHNYSINTFRRSKMSNVGDLASGDYLSRIEAACLAEEMADEPE